MFSILVLFAGLALAEPAELRWSSYRDVWFDHGSASLERNDLLHLTDVANYLRQHPSHRVGIDSGTDEDAALRQRRVDTVRAALVKAGVPLYKISEGTFGTEQFRRARRVELFVGARD
jgi:outer membrane protein OmpA-like peptidoglycan-associated protein